MRFVAVVAATSLRVVSVLQYYGTKGSVPMLSWFFLAIWLFFSIVIIFNSQSYVGRRTDTRHKLKLFNVQV